MLMILIYSSRSSSSSVMASNPEKPTIAFRGVRISWLMLARNADFRWSDSSAFSFASLSSFSASFSLVTFSILNTTPNKLSFESMIGLANTCVYSPGAHCLVNSKGFLLSMADISAHSSQKGFCPFLTRQQFVGPYWGLHGILIWFSHFTE